MIYNDFVEWLTKLDLSTIDANPITFNLTDFENDLDFTKSMFLAGRHLVNEEDIAVRYSKPYNEDKTDVTVRFQIVRSKAKMFNNFLKTPNNIYCRCDNSICKICENLNDFEKNYQETNDYHMYFKKNPFENLLNFLINPTDNPFFDESDENQFEYSQIYINSKKKTQTNFLIYM